jgi:outer membrane protein assembly factor BamB
MRRVLLIAAMAATIVACNNAKRENIQPPRELEDITASVSVQRLWSRSVGDVGGKPGLAMSAAYADGRLYTANTDGRITTLDAASGSEIDQIDTEHPFSTTPAVGDGVIAVGTLDGKLVVLDLASGAERHAIQLSSEVIAAPAVAEGRVFARSSDGQISAYRVDDGVRVWVQENAVPPLSLRGNGALRYDRGYVITGLDDGRLIAFRSEDGAPVWQQQVGLSEGRTDLERLADVDGDLAIADGYVYAVGFDGQAMAVDIATGAPLWSRELSAVSGVAYGDQLVISDAKGHVTALDRSTGGSLWTQEALEYRWLSTAAFAGGYVAVGDLEGYVHWLNPLDGAFVARERASRDPIRTAPIAVDNVVYVMTIGGTLAAYRVGG